MIDVINYGVRGLILIIGLVILSGFVDPLPGDTRARIAMGTVITLFGIWRIIIYRSKKQLTFHEDE